MANKYTSSSQYERKNRNQKKTTVNSTSLSTITKKYDLKKPIQLVVDIEGGEHDLFIEERDKISVIIFEYHSFTDHSFDYYSDILEQNGFELVDSHEGVYVYDNETM